MRWYWLALLPICMASASAARVTFVPLPPGTPFTAKIGAGGTPATVAGVDFWKGGAPARPYRVLGFLMGRSEAEILQSVGTLGLARQVRDSGGDALLVSDTADLPPPAQAAMRGIPGAPRFQFWIIKYLPAGAYAVAEDDHARQLIEMKAWTEDQCRDPNSMTSMAGLSPEERKAIREEIRKTMARIGQAIGHQPERVRRRDEEVHRLTMQMLDCQEQRQVQSATDAAIRGGVGTEVEWTSATRPAVQGRSIAAAQDTLGDGTHCITVRDVIIIDGEETISHKRMCRPRGASGYQKA